MKYTKTMNGNEHRDIPLFLLLLLTAAGIAAGASYVTAHGIADSIWLHQCLLPSASADLDKVFIRSFLSEAVFLAAFFLSGTSAIGQPLTAALLIYRGVGTGAAAAAEYCREGIGALSTVALLIVPLGAAYVLISLIAAREALRSSVRLLHILFGGSAPERSGSEGSLYVIRFIVLTVITLIAAAAETALYLLFGQAA